ncbi:hypothetical protein PMZ80_001581 [Knufia obscura]|uniref:Enoyl reductase (ER) domain-containing protein n=1 Tax=Knufia obscura TaxID=1635080 RepID=A0ABR0S3P1_9EURO|nr:hypothetical protein PMZ80_001581 [Knufia obscura]
MSPSHPAIVTVRPSSPLQILQIPTPNPTTNEVKLIVQYTASTPLDHHQASAHLLVTPPQILGDGVAGTVLSTGPDVTRYKLGDQVFGFVWRNAKEKAHQLYCVCPENLLGRVPEGKSMQEAVVLGNNFVTVWHAFTREFGFELPWNRGLDGGAKGKPEGYVPPKREVETEGGRKKWILVWGGSSSCGMYGIQVLRYYGYGNVIAVAGSRHHGTLKRYGAEVCFDYRGEGDVVERVKEFVWKDGGEVAYIFDCIGSLEGSLRPVARIASAEGCKIAVLLPVVVKDAAPGVKPEYEMDVTKCADWAEGVMPSGVRTHFWMDNKVLAETLQTEIMPWALETGVVEPNAQIIVEGETMLERAQSALNMLRDKKVSGGRLVWRVAEQKQVAEALDGIRQ